jgi:AcrR family transcriptional regulator
MSKRPYVQRQRAERQEATRARIVQAAMHLHEEVGPARTTISAIAERAGVQRLTVYRHFHDETALFAACTSSWLERNPPPSPQLWQSQQDPSERARAALLALYGYYRRTEAMWTRAYRDADLVEALQAPMAGFESYLAGVRNDLLSAWQPPATARRPLKAALGVALRFSTWRSFALEKVADGDASDWIVRWLSALREQRAQPSRRAARNGR